MNLNNMSIFKPFKRNNKVTKDFDYSQGDVSLRFSLRIDVKKEMKDFVELLKVAIQEVEEELKKLQ